MKPKTDWFKNAGWGVFLSYLDEPASGMEVSTTSVEAWSKRVDGFDVDVLARQLHSVGAGYVCLTIGQNSGFYCSPNATYDGFVGIAPGKCSRRDLIADLYAAFNLNPATELNSSKAKAALAGQAITHNISQVVAVTLADNLDDHFDEAGAQSQSLSEGFDALGRLIAFLKSKTVPGTSKTFWSCTSLMTFSEFSRTPLLNARDGRDHHLTGSCLLAGPGLKGGTVFGASSDVGMQAQKFNFTSGAVDQANGASVRPSDVHATLLKSMGLDYSHLSNTSPATISKLLKNP